eukprot:gene17238-18958_t
MEADVVKMDEDIRQMKEKNAIKVGYERIKEKVQQLRCNFKKAIIEEYQRRLSPADLSNEQIEDQLEDDALNAVTMYYIYQMKEFPAGSNNKEEQIFGYKLSSARMVIESAFGRLKARFGTLKREMDINLLHLPHLVYV